MQPPFSQVAWLTSDLEPFSEMEDAKNTNDTFEEQGVRFEERTNRILEIPDAGVCEKYAPPDKNTGWKISSENTQTGAG